MGWEAPVFRPGGCHALRADRSDRLKVGAVESHMVSAILWMSVRSSPRYLRQQQAEKRYLQRSYTTATRDESPLFAVVARFVEGIISRLHIGVSQQCVLVVLVVSRGLVVLVRRFLLPHNLPHSGMMIGIMNDCVQGRMSKRSEGRRLRVALISARPRAPFTSTIIKGSQTLKGRQRQAETNIL